MDGNTAEHNGLTGKVKKTAPKTLMYRSVFMGIIGNTHLISHEETKTAQSNLYSGKCLSPLQYVSMLAAVPHLLIMHAWCWYIYIYYTRRCTQLQLLVGSNSWINTTVTWDGSVFVKISAVRYTSDLLRILENYPFK